MSLFPRLTLIWKVSNRHTTASIFKKISAEDTGRHVAVVSTTHPGTQAVLNSAGVKPASVQACNLVGEMLASKAKQLDIDLVKINRSTSYVYHGKVAAIIDSLKKNGLKVH